MRSSGSITRLTSSSAIRPSTGIDPTVIVPRQKSPIRRFKSRHVPGVAEDVSHEDESIRQRFCGLMAHLRNNSVAQEEEHQILSVGVGIVEEDAQALHEIFEHYCNIAERMNTEMLSVTKFDKLLEDVLRAHHKKSNKRNERTIVCYRVLRSMEPPSTRLDFEGFCKSLGLLAMRMYPRMDTQAALDHLVQMIVSATYILLPTQESRTGDCSVEDLCGDTEAYSLVLDVIKKYERNLQDIFNQFCGKNAVPGESLDASGNLGSTIVQQKQFSTYTKARKSAPPEGVTAPLEGCSPTSSTRSSTARRATAASTTPPDKHEYAGISFDVDTYGGSPEHSMTDGLLHGVPTIKGWQHKLNFQQWRCMLKEIGVYPYLCTNRQLAVVFKRSNDAHSAYGFLSHAGFLEAVIRLAIDCYSESPFAEEFLTIADRVNGFLHRFLGAIRHPASKRSSALERRSSAAEALQRSPGETG